MAKIRLSLDEFLRPLDIDTPKIQNLARSLAVTYTTLAAEAENQFLATPISESILRPEGEATGR